MILMDLESWKLYIVGFSSINISNETIVSFHILTYQGRKFGDDRGMTKGAGWDENIYTT